MSASSAIGHGMGKGQREPGGKTSVSPPGFLCNSYLCFRFPVAGLSNSVPSSVKREP